MESHDGNGWNSILATVSWGDGVRADGDWCSGGNREVCVLQAVDSPWPISAKERMILAAS